MRLIPFVLVIVLSCSDLFAQYSISGRVNLGPEWQPKVYMAAVNKLNDYYRTSPDMILNTAPVADDGSFSLHGDNLPADSRFYRLYLMKNENTDYDACLYVGGDDHNFVHVILENGGSVEVIADSASIAPFGNYSVVGDAENRSMRQLSNVVFPSFYFYRIKFPTELKFSEDKFYQDLKAFADTSAHTLVALAAVNNIDFDEYFDRDQEFFRQFGERLKKEAPKSIYSKNYLSKVSYYEGEEKQAGTTSTLIIGFLLLALLGSLFFIFKLKKQIHAQQVAQLVPNTVDASGSRSIRDRLTNKELEILQLIHGRKSNKDIATALYVELSTVKTHINKIYSKIGAANRKEAQSIADQVFDSSTEGV